MCNTQKDANSQCLIKKCVVEIFFGKKAPSNKYAESSVKN